MNNDVAAQDFKLHVPRVRVWDLPVRLFHWSLVVLMATLFITAEVLDDAMEIHALAGTAVLALVSFRILWGFAGSTYARFGNFLHNPGEVWRYSRTLFEARPAFTAGHNPLGGWMVVVLLSLILLQAVIGLFANDDVAFEGPLAHLVSSDTSEALTAFHEQIFHVLLVLVALHVAAVIWHKIFKGDNLVAAMFTGYKELPPGVKAADSKGGGILLAVAILAACAALAYWVTLAT